MEDDQADLGDIDEEQENGRNSDSQMQLAIRECKPRIECKTG